MKIEFTGEQLKIIDIALEAFARGRAGQFDILFEFLFPDLDYEQRRSIQKDIQYKMDSFVLSGGRNYDKTKRDLLTWDMHKLFDEYLSVKENGGWGMTVNFDGPISRENLPIIEDFSQYRELVFPDNIQEKAQELYANGLTLEIVDLAKDQFGVKSFSSAQPFEQEKKRNMVDTFSKRIFNWS